MLTAFQSIQDAYKFLQELGASSHLIQHVKLVGEAAELLILQFQELGIRLDLDWIRLGVAFHDVGKILYPLELSTKGSQHEAAGEAMLLSKGINPKIARCCRSHGQWQQMHCNFEELVIALADNLWKGKRNTELEDKVIKDVTEMCHQNYWDIFLILDSCFEQIAAGGQRRLSLTMRI